MITIFNRKELCITYSIEEQARIRDLLSAHNMDYIFTSFDSASLISTVVQNSSCRSLPVMTADHQPRYKFYVKRSDYEEALAILHGKI